MNRPSWLWLALATSGLAHGVFGWQLQQAPRRAPASPERDPFQVRMIALPPPPPPRALEPPPPPPVAALPPPAPPPPARQVPPKAVSPKPRAAAAAPPDSPPAPPAAPEATSAPPALLAESGSRGGIVQLAGAPIGALATSERSPAAPPPPVSPPARAAPLAKLSDLSRKPRAPSLDAALRQNYPAELRRRGMQGQAEVRVVIDARGRVGDVAIVSESATGFAEACKRTLFGSLWSEPLDRDGEPVSTQLTYRCRFEIER